MEDLGLAVPPDYVGKEQELDELWENNISSGALPATFAS